MVYEEIAGELRIKIEELQSSNELLTKSNEKLKDELAVALNENYVMRAKNHILLQKYENDLLSINSCLMEVEQNKIMQVKNLENQLAICMEELAMIKSSNTFKLWMIYGRLPKPFRKIMRGFLEIGKNLYRIVKKVTV